MGKSIKNIIKVAFPTQYWGTKATVSAAQKAGAVLGMGKKEGPSTGVDTSDYGLQKEKEDNSKKRLRLYATENDELGEEVEGIGISSKRGKLFANQ